MRSKSGTIHLSASDLSNHLACRHTTSLDWSVAAGARAAPKWHAPDSWVLQERGLAHEHAYMRHLEAQGLVIENLIGIEDGGTAVEATRAAMGKGADAIAQATLAEGRWFGRADLLRRTDSPSELGNWSYEVYDCKLANETKAGTILQLSLYSELVAAVQGVAPERMYVVPPSETFETVPYRLLDFAAYYRYVKARLEQASARVDGPDLTYPEPVAHCAVCRWFLECDAALRRDDHLSLVAGISKLQRKQLMIWETKTVSRLAVLPLPLQHRPKQGSVDSYIRIREQARIQVAGRNSREPVYEVLDLDAEHGFGMLPEPSAGDMFFDLEGDPCVGKRGREYLFGFVLQTEEAQPEYKSCWGLCPEEEKKSFEGSSIQLWRDGLHTQGCISITSPLMSPQL